MADTTGGDDGIKVGFILDEATVNALLATLNQKMSDGVDRIFESMQETVREFTKETVKHMRRVEDAMRHTAHEGEAVGEAMAHGMHQTSRETVGLIQTLQKLDAAVSNINSAILATRTQTRQEMIRGTAEINNASRESINQTRAASKERIVQMQKETALASAAAKHRTAIAQQMWAQIGRIEKAGGMAVAGVARTTVAAVSKLYGTLTSFFHRQANTEKTIMTQGFTQALNTRERELRSSMATQERILRSSVTRQQVMMQEFNRKMSTGLAGAITGRGIGIGVAGLIGGVGLATLFRTGYQDAINYGEQVNKNTVIFEEYAQEVIDFAKNAPSQFGATEAEVLAATGLFGNLFDTIGIGSQQNAMMSESLVQLATDLSSFNNVPVEEVFTALKAGLVGESEPLRNLGIDVSDATLRIEAMNLGIYDGTGVLTQQQKALAAYSVILKQTSKAQGDFARTAEEGANAIRRRQAAMRQFFSDLNQFILPAMTQLNLALMNMFTSLSAVLTSTSDAMVTFRHVLAGVAIGMGSVIAAKGIIEVIQLLGQAFKFALTPFGATLVIAGLLGGAIALMMEKSDKLRYALQELWAQLGTVAAEILNSVVPAIQSAVTWLGDSLAGAAEAAGDWIGEHLQNAINKTVTFITDTAVPAIQSFVSWLVTAAQAVYDAFMAFATTGPLGSFLDWVRDTAIPAVVDFAEAVALLLEPAIEGFKDLASAIGDAFGGDFSNLGDGVRSLVAGIVASVGNIAGAIGEALAPIVQTVFEFFRDLFSPDNVKKMIAGLLDLVEKVGYILGQIVSDPRLYKVIAAVAAAAVVVALRFVEGFIKGVADHADEIIAALVDLFQMIFKAVLSNPAVFLAGALAVVAAKNIYQAFSKLGAAGGSGFAAGLKGAMQNSTAYLSGFFAGPGLSKSTSRLNSAAIEANDINRRLRAFGSSSRIELLTESEFVRTRGLLASYKDQMSEARMAALLARDALQQFGSTVKTVGSTVPTAMRGIGASFRSAFETFRYESRLAMGSRDFLRVDQLKQQAVIAGRAVGRAWNDAIGSQVMGGWKIIGQSARSGFTMARVAASEAFDVVKAKAKTVGREVNVAFGGVASGMVTAFKTVSGKIRSVMESAALGAMYAFDKVTGSKGFKLGQALVSAIGQGFKGAGQAIAGAWTSMVANLRAIADANGTSIGKVLAMGIGKGMVAAAGAVGGFIAGKAEGSSGGSGWLSALFAGVGTAGALGFTPVGIAAGVAAGGVAMFGAALGRAQAKAKEFKASVQQLADTMVEDLKTALEEGTLALSDLNDLTIGGLDTELLTKYVTDAIEGLSEAETDLLTIVQEEGDFRLLDAFRVASVRAAGDIEKFGEIVNDIFITAAATTDEFVATFGAASQEVRDFLLMIAEPGGIKTVRAGMFTAEFDALSESTQEAIKDNEDYLQSILDTGVALDEQGRMAADAFDAAIAQADAIRTEMESGVTPSVDEATAAWKRFYDAGMAAEDIDLKFGEMGLEPPDTTAWRRVVDKATEEVDELKAALEGAKDAADLLFNPYSSTFQEATDDLILSVIDIGEELDGIIETSELADPSKIREALEPLSTIIGDVVRTGLENNIAEADIAAQLESARAGLIAALDPNDPGYQAAVDEINKTVDAALADLGITIDEIQTGEQAVALHEQIQEYLATHAFSTEVEARMEITYPEDGNSGAPGRNSGTDLPSFTVSPPTDALNTTPEMDAAAQEAGARAAEIFMGAFGGGITDSEGNVETSLIDVIVNASNGSGDDARTAAAPVGRAVTSGLGTGIRAGTSGVITAIIATVRAAINAAKKELDISSPSKVFEDIGMQITAGLSIGIDDTANRALASAEALVTDVQNLYASNVPQRAMSMAASAPSPSEQTLTRSDVVALARAVAAEAKPNNTFNQTFERPVDSRAIATDIAWRLA